MLVEENANKKILDKICIIKEKKILREFVNYYKAFMNSKLKELKYITFINMEKSMKKY